MENLNLIRKIAWSFHNTTGIDYEELFSEASLAYCEALRTHDPEKSSLSTWAWTHMNLALTIFSKKEKCAAIPFSTFGEDISFGYTQMTDKFSEFLTDLPADCKYIANEILDNEYRYTGQSPNMKRSKTVQPKFARGKLYRTLRTRGWAWSKIWSGFKNMRAALNETQILHII